MAKVLIIWDEWYTCFVQPMWRDEDGCPALYLPTEIPDELWDEYQQAYKAFAAIKRQIHETYGHSERNPNYHDEFTAWQNEKFPPPEPIVEDYDEYMARMERQADA